MRISLVVLTFNRAEIVKRSMAHNLAKANYPISELVWVDNGSTDGVRDVMMSYKPDVSILNSQNLGVAKGYNRGFALATGDYIVITGCDMLMPDDWLALFVTYFMVIKNTGVATILHHPLPDAAEMPIMECDGYYYQRCAPLGRRCVRRDLLTKKIGYLREDFGLYGFEDIEWGKRASAVCRREGLLTYAIVGRHAEHLGTEGNKNYDGKDSEDYHAFKKSELASTKGQIIEKSRVAGWPYYNPYA